MQQLGVTGFIYEQQDRGTALHNIKTVLYSAVFFCYGLCHVFSDSPAVEKAQDALQFPWSKGSWICPGHLSAALK